MSQKVSFFDGVCVKEFGAPAARDYHICGNYKVVGSDGVTEVPVGTEGAQLLALGDLGTDGKYHILVKNGDKVAGEIVLDEPLRKINDSIKDYVDFGTMTLYRCVKQHIFNGTENWTGSDGYVTGDNMHNLLLNLVTIRRPIQMICSLYKYKYKEYTGFTQGYFGYNYYGRFGFSDGNYANVASWKQHLVELYAQGKPLSVFYELTSPTTERITLRPLCLSEQTTFATAVQPSSATYVDKEGASHTII